MLALVVVLAAGCTTREEKRLRVEPERRVPSIWPVRSAQCVVTSQFGARGGAHKGFDIAAPKGSPVVATADGAVLFAGRADRYGRLIRLGHAAGFETWYAHLRAILVKPGGRVRQGQPIGEVGATGNATGPNLHYEVRRNGIPVDPRPYLPQRP